MCYRNSIYRFLRRLNVTNREEIVQRILMGLIFLSIFDFASRFFKLSNFLISFNMNRKPFREEGPVAISTNTFDLC